MTQEQQQLLNKQHYDNPEVGDYWHERFSPYFIVLEVHESGEFVICDVKKEVDKDHWTFDLEQSKLVTHSYFNKVRYGSIDGFVADVVPKKHMSFVNSWKEISVEDRKHILFPVKVVMIDEEFLPAFDPLENRIVCACNRYSDGTMILGVRHFDSIMKDTMEKINPDMKYWSKLGHEQGFIDKFYKFQTREDARKIAINAKQIVRWTGGDDRELFSENLY